MRAARGLLTAAVVLACLGTGVLVLLLAGHDPIAALGALGRGAFGSAYRLAETLLCATPLALCGLAVAWSFRAGLLNIGGEGQYLAGAIAATVAGLRVGAWPTPLALAAVFLAGAAGGTVPALLAGWLRVRRGVSEVLGTILLNFTLLELTRLLLQGPLMGAASLGHPESDLIADSARLPLLWGETRLHLGCALLLLLPVVVHVGLFHTRIGLLLHAAGDAPEAVRFGGFSLPRIQLWAFAGSGALCGLAAACQLSGVVGFLSERFSGGTGYAAIGVALLGRLHPLGIAAAALFFGALEAGSETMQAEAQVPAALVRVFQAVAILGALLLARRVAPAAGDA